MTIILPTCGRFVRRSASALPDAQKLGGIPSSRQRSDLRYALRARHPSPPWSHDRSCGGPRAGGLAATHSAAGGSPARAQARPSRAEPGAPTIPSNRSHRSRPRAQRAHASARARCAVAYAARRFGPRHTRRCEGRRSLETSARREPWGDAPIHLSRRAEPMRVRSVAPRAPAGCA